MCIRKENELQDAVDHTIIRAIDKLVVEYGPLSLSDKMVEDFKDHLKNVIRTKLWKEME